MPQYKVKPDVRHGVAGRYGPGDIIELAERDAAPFSDKLELDDPEAELEVELSPLARFRIFDARILKLLEGAGLETLSDVADATDDELLAIDGIGQLTLARIREQISEVIDVDTEI